MKASIFGRISTVLFFCVLMAPLPAGAQETAGALLAKLAKLSPEARQKALVDGARAEKEVTFYTSLQPPQVEPFARVFQKRYPFVKVNGVRISGSKAVVRIQSEMNAGKSLVDVINVSGEEAAALKKVGALDPYLSPQREFYPPSAKDKDGYLTAMSFLTMVLGYNTNLVKRADVPKSYDDLLQPRWKGQMFLDNEAYDWFAVLLKHFGREKGLQYMRALAKQDLAMMRGRTAQAQLLVAGERAIGIVQSGNTMLDYKAKGAPVDMSILDPYLALSNSIMLAKHALHPYAAALLIDWSLSEEGQSVVTSFGRVVLRKGVKQRFPELMEKELFVTDSEFLGPILEESAREFRQIFLGGR
ncbi:MAG TPA: extracellular solute-binding protein [Candidatus Limnocylindrales bacterium]|nr:extracellular solute-binding protein [Candidatus Limnocylindrales bacterium]